MVSEKTHLDTQQNTDRFLGWALVALLCCFVAYLVGVYVLWPQEEQELVVHEPLPQDPPKPAEPFIWGSLPVSKPGPSSDKDERQLDGESSKDAAQAEQLASPRKLPGISSEAAPYAFFAGPELGKVKRETVRALKSGDTQIWKAGDQRGYVLVSTPRHDGDRECRQVSYSLFEGPLQSLSPTSQWCREGRGRWSPG